MNKLYLFLILLTLITTTALSQTPQTVRYEYDALSRLTRATYPNSVTVIYNYDVLGNRTSVVVSQAVAGQPDLTVINQSVSPVTISAGGSVVASCTVSNLQATAVVSAFKLRYYLSTDNQYDAGDTEVGTSQTINAPFTGEQTVSSTINLPNGVSGGRYILFFVDANNQVTNEVSETNNVVAVGITITTTCPTITVTVSTNPSSSGGSTGSATASVTGGQSPYTYAWSNGGNTQTISNLTADTYNVTVIDANGCQGTGSGVVSSSGSCTSMYSVKTGNWNDAAVWSCNRVPLSSDAVLVSAGHIVTMPAGVTGDALRVHQVGRLVFGTGAKLRLGINAPVVLVADLLLYYPFDGNVNDASGNNRNGTANGSLTFTTDRTGTANKAANFDGTSAWVDTPYSQSTLTEFTVSVWVKTDIGVVANTNPSAIIQNRNTGSGNSITLDYDRSDGAWEFGIDANSTKICKRVVAANTNTWRHIVGVWKGTGSINSSQFKLYINGVLQTTTPVDFGSGTSPFIASGTMKIAYHQAWNTYFRGGLDDLRIYSRALTDAEIQALASQ